MTCSELAISSIAAFTSLSTVAAFLRGGLWQDPRQPRQLLVPTEWSGPFACSQHAGGPLCFCLCVILSYLKNDPGSHSHDLWKMIEVPVSRVQREIVLKDERREPFARGSQADTAVGFVLRKP